jgi:ankyrin repeat protein
VPKISIHEAAAKGNIEIVRQHLAVQPEGQVNAQTPTGWTPLHFAYAQGRQEMSRFLLDNGADYEAKNNLG